MKNTIDWFKGKKWGLMAHFLAAAPLSEKAREITPEEWNERVDAFDVELLAKDISETTASYVCLTIGQNSGHFCAPNPTYDRLTGIAPSRCSKGIWSATCQTRYLKLMWI